MSFAARFASALLDPTIVWSFNRTGFRLHQASFNPADLDVDLTGKICLVTGANSGIGFATAQALHARGASVRLLCRNPERGAAAAAKLPGAVCDVLDIADLDAVRRYVAGLSVPRVDVLVHNAGVLPDRLLYSPQGAELTLATHVLGPFLLTRLLQPVLRPDSRVIFVSSGGMYSQQLRVADLTHPPTPYDGVTAYARTKRAQVVLAELLGPRLGCYVYSMHPGWADTPAVQTSIPRFHQLTRRMLRTPEEGADTVIWLAARRQPPKEGFYFDRAAVRTHYLPWTQETEAERQALWALCEGG